MFAAATAASRNAEAFAERLDGSSTGVNGVEHFALGDSFAETNVHAFIKYELFSIASESAFDL